MVESATNSISSAPLPSRRKTGKTVGPARPFNSMAVQDSTLETENSCLVYESALGAAQPMASSKDSVERATTVPAVNIDYS